MIVTSSHRNTWAPLARNYTESYVNRPSSGAHGPIEDIEPARNGPRLPEGSILANYDCSKWWRSKRSGACNASSSNSATNRCLGAQRASSYDN